MSGTAIPGLALEPGAGESAAILARLHGLYPKLIDLSLTRVQRLLDSLGNPERHLPPVLHVAGTNGKGSTCANLRAIGEAAGLRVHMTTSPHLVHLTERFYVAGQDVAPDVLAATLAELERVNDGAPITVFEVLAAAAFVLFARVPADICVVEVGLGGRFDATNVVHPASCAIASISFDHREFLGDTLAQIAGEKAGIMKPGVPAASVAQPPEAQAVLLQEAARLGCPLALQGRDWRIVPQGARLHYEDRHGTLDLPPPCLAGPHQIDNAGLAIATMRAAALPVADHAYGGIAQARWPARLQRLQGGLLALLPAGSELYLDGGHNEGAGQALAAALKAWRDRPLYLLVGMKKSKDAQGFLRPLLDLADAVFAVREAGQHLAAEIADIIAAAGGAARPGPDVRGALAALGAMPPGRVVICGSLYLAGEVLKADAGPPRSPERSP